MSKNLTLGYAGEYGARAMTIDLYEEAELWPDATPKLLLCRPGEDAPYVFEGTTYENSCLTFTPRKVDTAIAGTGYAQVYFYGADGALLGKSGMMTTLILRAMSGDVTQEPSAEQKSYYDNLMEQVALAVAAGKTAPGYAQIAAESAAAAAAAQEAAEAAASSVTITTDEINAAGNAALSAIEQKRASALADIPDDYTALYGDVSSLKDTIVDKSEGLISTIEGSDLTICPDGMDKPLKSITVDGIGTDGAALMGFDKMVVLDGTEAWRASASFANAYRTGGVLKDALTTGYMQGVCDGYDVQRSAESRINSLRLGSQSSNYEITAFTDYAELDAFKASLAAQPKRIWYRSALYDANEPQYYAVCVNKSGNVDTAYAAIGTTEKINPLGEGDTIDFISGIVTRADGSKETIALNRTAVGLGGEALVIKTHAKLGNIHVKYARDLAEKFQTVTGLDTPPPMLTIIDDDGHIGFHDVLLPVIKSKNVPIAAAVCTNRANGEVSSSWMSWDKILECYKSGAEILCHNYSHMSVEEVRAMTYDEIYHAFIKARNELRAHGVGGPNIFVYNGGTGDIEKVRKAASRVFDCAILPTGAVVNRTTDNRRWEIQRYGVGNYEVDALCERIDQCAAEGGWMVWMVHTSSEITADTVWKLEAAIDHAKEVGVDIVTAECGYRYYVDRFASR